MAQAFGYNSYVGIGDESTYGTAVTPTKFTEILEESMNTTDIYIHKPSLAGVSQNRRVSSKVDVNGDVKFQVTYTGIIEKILKNALGTSNVTGAGPYTHDYSLANALPTGLTVQCSRDSTNLGSTSATNYVGCHISKLTLSQGVEDFLTASVSFVGKSQAMVTATAASYPATFYGVQWEHLTTSINSITSYNVRSVEIMLDNALATDRFNLGTRNRSGTGRAQQRKITAKITAEFNDLALGALYRGRTAVPVILAWADSPRSLTITLPWAYLSSYKAVASTAGPLLQEMEFEAFISSVQNDELLCSLVNATAGPD